MGIEIPKVVGHSRSLLFDTGGLDDIGGFVKGVKIEYLEAHTP
jgi:hypothetical protein